MLPISYCKTDSLGYFPLSGICLVEKEKHWNNWTLAQYITSRPQCQHIILSNHNITYVVSSIKHNLNSRFHQSHTTPGWCTRVCAHSTPALINNTHQTNTNQLGREHHRKQREAAASQVAAQHTNPSIPRSHILVKTHHLFARERK
jgi:hypothetical protein